MGEIEYTYDEYTITGEQELPAYLQRLLVMLNGTRDERNVAEPILKTITPQIGVALTQQLYGIQLYPAGNPTPVTNGRQQNELMYGVCVCITRHLCTAIICYGKYDAYIPTLTGNQKGIHPLNIWYIDAHVRDENPESDSLEAADHPLVIERAHCWKMSLGAIPSIEFHWIPSETVGIKAVDATTAKTPLFGITGKKLLVPPHSYFVDGSHQELYEYPYYFFNSEKPVVDGLPNENWKTNATIGNFYRTTKNPVYLPEDM